MTSAHHIEIAAQLLSELPISLDRLPYTGDFEEVYAEFLRRAGAEGSRHEVWWTLLHARKRGLGLVSRRFRRLRSSSPGAPPMKA